ncbi:PQQ-dependent dehydrogenase, methanol/ethanol family [Methylomicrobium lacus]|uniref:PQQ-dependent dehydrogenase, methanol/ethanol family n=1 Tax=Methylomicrobium lacus TaxID=136992 RepID=UPI0035A84B54
MTVKNKVRYNKELLHRSNARPTPIYAGVTLALMLGGGAMSVETASADVATAAAATNNWTTAGGTLQGTRYSALSDITRQNVGSLKEKFSFKTEASGSHMGEPLVVGSMLYVVTPYPNKLIAYDLAKGERKWTYEPGVSEYAKGVNCCDAINRGAAYAKGALNGVGMVVFNTLDNKTVAVNAATGKAVWQTKNADEHTGVTMAGAPIIAENRVFVGSVSGEMGIPGWIQALDLDTGKKLWRAYNTGPDIDPDASHLEPNRFEVKINNDPSKTDIPLFSPFYAKDKGENLATEKTWSGSTSYKQGGSSVWAYLTYDPATKTLFYGTSQPGVWNPDMRCDKQKYINDPQTQSCDNKWGASIFARDPFTGYAKWAYQVTPFDNWDYDSISENIAVDQKVDGVDRQLLVHFDKNGFAYTFDRVTGQILNAPKFVDDQNVNWASGIDKEGKPLVNSDKLTHQGELVEDICPSALGAKGWEPGAFSPKTGLFYMPTFNLCMSMHMLQADFVAGAPFMGMDMGMGPGHARVDEDRAKLNPTLKIGDPFLSELIAWDAATGKRVWAIPESKAIYGGILATAGNVSDPADKGLVFYGTQDKKFKAIDAGTGVKLFETTFECSTVGNPISFKGPTGKQMVAVFTGVGAMAGGLGGGGKCLGDGGGRVHVLALP